MKRQGLGPVLEGDRRRPTPSATAQAADADAHAALQEAVEHQQPQARRARSGPKLRYAHQGGMNPPVIVIHGNSLEHVTDAYKRFLEGRFRDAFQLVGTPLRIEMQTGAEPVTPTRSKPPALQDVRAARRWCDQPAAARHCCGNVPASNNNSNTEHIVSNKGQLLQDPFLNTLRKEHVPVSIYLVNGIKLQGQIESFDQYVVLLRTP